MRPVRADSLLDRIDPRFRAVWANRLPAEQSALAWYFLPQHSQRTYLAPTRPRLIKWYCPFASQAVFPSGHRYALNVYAGCAHACLYCYAASYEPEIATPKRTFHRLLAKDLFDLERFDVPPAPIHLSNSTDPFQPLERHLGHTRAALEGILAHRRRFTTVVLLTKNPALAAEPAYTGLLRRLAELPAARPRGASRSLPAEPGVQVEVSLAFWRDEARAFWDPGAPTVAERMAGLRALQAAGIPLVLRIDPLFPRSPLGGNGPARLADFGLVEAQTLEDLERLIVLAQELGARHIVYSPVKIVQPRRRPLVPAMVALRAVYEAMARPERLVWQGGSWRLPASVSRQYVVEPFLVLCRRHQVTAKFCMQNLIQTP